MALELSLDPRINRLTFSETEKPVSETETSLQLPDYEVFQQLKPGKPWESVGGIHAPSLEMAIIFAKEQYSRRGNLFYGLAVCANKTKHEWINEGIGENLLTSLKVKYQSENLTAEGSPQANYLVFIQKKRGKSYIHAGNLPAQNETAALQIATETLFTDTCSGVWIIREDDFLKTTDEDAHFWDTLPEKKYREVIMYKSLDKITAWKAKNEKSL